MSIRVVTGTGFHGESKKKVKHDLEQLGLSYSGDLTLGATDILLCGEGVDLSSEKVKVARLWQLPIVTYAWIAACLMAGEVLRTDSFLVRLSSDAEPDYLDNDLSCSTEPRLASSAPVPSDGLSDCRSSYPPVRLSRSRQSGKWDEDDQVMSPKSPKSPSFISHPIEMLRSIKHKSDHQPSEKEFEFPQFVDLQGTSGHNMLHSPESIAKPGCEACYALFDDPPMPPSHSSTPIPSPVPTELAAPHEMALSSAREILDEFQSLKLDEHGDSPSTSLPPPASSADRTCSSQHAPSVLVKVSDKLQRAPKKSTAAAYHGCAPRSLTFYNKLVVQDPAQGSCFIFSMKDTSHCALVYYDDAGPDGHELAYCDLYHTYTMQDGQAWIEHGYLNDAADLQQHPMGQRFLNSHAVADDELVNTHGLYHSPARVIEGEFYLYHTRKEAERAHQRCAEGNGLFLFTNKTWDRKTGALLMRPQ